MTNPAYKLGYAVGNVTVISDVDDLLVLRRNFVPGNMWAWGSDSYSALGDGGTTSVSSPIHIGSATDWKETTVFSGGWDGGAISTSGNLYVWGTNTFGQLGLGDISPRSVPTQLGPVTTWKQISFGGGIGPFSANFALAIRSDSSMWGWGSYNSYQLGNGLTIGNASSPVQVGNTLYNWKQLAAASGFGLAIDNSGSLWAWGYNGYGQLGQNDTITRSIPVPVGTLTTWTYVTASSSSTSGSSYGLSSNGTLWAWGYNGSGQLGLGDTVDRSVPTQVGTGGWRSIAAGIDHVVAVSASGKLFTWGNNPYGQLGQITVTNLSSPVQVGLLSDWKTAIAGGYSSGSVKTDNTLWTWGYNASGQLGQNNMTALSSPVQVGSGTTWKSVSMGTYHTLATIYSF
ncbi:Regulator of chromosome condensation, RCC1 [uncultured Caudovirales phage]|uniref:Regulator of chromosome condensation, RCC1 n=1 Tax=uncultured Caudovirales phage TaxID=2100421 RepID=A0A6J5KPM3_9CAUD|nr:Regulator of chromosome condensation, RCC1 [uncultured Caudovirales phage]